ncbi:hypothetical protein [Streptomyces sp. ID05-47C]|uniref:hypothetical protein n=1 Tax=Streptomyces sp. ID05-47C TaxID=3028665 RepID=UPI0029BEBA42|nr:hypothetical protein [Streptomyces sp. ID05-47C]MDX3573761.1 hypothetical protein [Streptomyces sp. ID05-47C]
MRSLVLEVLGETSEPRMVSEFVDALAKHHPNRAPSTAVVRNTLESLVAKGIAQRTRTEGSVFYTPSASSAVGGDGATAAPKVDEPVPDET